MECTVRVRRDRSFYPDIAEFEIDVDEPVSRLKQQLMALCDVPGLTESEVVLDSEFRFPLLDGNRPIADLQRNVVCMRYYPWALKVPTTVRLHRLCRVNDTGTKDFRIYLVNGFNFCFPNEARYVRGSDSVSSLKETVSDIPLYRGLSHFRGYSEVVLYDFRDGRVLDDTRTLGENGITPGSVLGVEGRESETASPPADPFPVTVRTGGTEQGVTVYVRPWETLWHVEVRLWLLGHTRCSYKYPSEEKTGQQFGFYSLSGYDWGDMESPVGGLNIVPGSHFELQWSPLSTGEESNVIDIILDEGFVSQTMSHTESDDDIFSLKPRSSSGLRKWKSKSIPSDVRNLVSSKLMSSSDDDIVSLKSRSSSGVQYETPIAAERQAWTCKICGFGQDIVHWKEEMPERLSEDGMSFRLKLPAAGRYQCTETGLRLDTKVGTTVEYKYCSWRHCAPDLLGQSWNPAGPLMHITANDSDITSLHIPHFICWKDHDEKDICVLHKVEDNYYVETPSEIYPGYVSLHKPTFSIFGALQKLFSKRTLIHSLVKVYGIVYPSRAVLHIYLIPNDKSIKQAVASQEKNSVRISKPPQTKKAIPLQATYYLRSSSDVKIQPSELLYVHLDCDQEQSFCEVYNKDKSKEFDLFFLKNIPEISQEDNDKIWECEIRPDDFDVRPVADDFDVRPVAGGGLEPVEEKHFMDRHKTKIIECLVTLAPILDHLVQKNYITNEDYDCIRSKPTPQEQNRELYRVARSWNCRVKEQFYIILKRENPQLVISLEGQ